MWWSLGSHVKASLPTGVRSPNPSTILCQTASQPKTVTSTPACHQRHPFIPLLVSLSFSFLYLPFFIFFSHLLGSTPIHNSPTTPSAHRPTPAVSLSLSSHPPGLIPPWPLQMVDLAARTTVCRCKSSWIVCAVVGQRVWGWNCVSLTDW